MLYALGLELLLALKPLSSLFVVIKISDLRFLELKTCIDRCMAMCFPSFFKFGNSKSFLIRESLNSGHIITSQPHRELKYLQGWTEPVNEERLSDLAVLLKIQ